MGKVFIVQEPMKRDRVSGNLVPFMDLTPAAAYGELEVLLPHGQVALSPAPMISGLKRSLAKFSDEDYLVLVGDPVAMSIATAIAAKVNNGKVKVLKWNRETRSYIQVALNI